MKAHIRFPILFPSRNSKESSRYSRRYFKVRKQLKFFRIGWLKILREILFYLYLHSCTFHISKLLHIFYINGDFAALRQIATFGLPILPPNSLFSSDDITIPLPAPSILMAQFSFISVPHLRHSIIDQNLRPFFPDYYDFVPTKNQPIMF